MSDRLAAAQAAVNAGRKSEAIDLLIAEVAANPDQGPQVYRALVVQLFGAGRFEAGEQYAAQGLTRHPRDYELLNTRGVLLRRLRRQAEAVPVLELAVKINPKHSAAQQNLGNVLMDLREGARAEAVFSKLVRLDPRNAEYQRQLGRALSQQDKLEPALMRFRLATTLNRNGTDAWLDMAGVLNDEHRVEEALQVLAKALAAIPGDRRLLEGKAKMLRRSGRVAEAEAFLTEVLGASDNIAWAHSQMGGLIADRDRDRANLHLRRAVALEPAELTHALSLIESLERTRSGDEGGHIEEAYQLARSLLPRRVEFTEVALKVLNEVFIRVCDFEALDQLGDFKTMGRAWASNGRHTALLKQLARVRTDEDRLELVEQHRIWGRDVEALAARHPLRRPAPRADGGKIRLGFMSSDLRQHPVGYFALPLFEHVDSERFEVFVYSYNKGGEDSAQRYIASRIAAYRWTPDISAPVAAQQIADDQLDMLIELGGSTHMNKLEVMAYRPAPLQASWLGYPHSAGLSTIDYLICDPHTVPPRQELLIERPLTMPKTWIALGSRFFSNAVPIGEAPELRNGFITYGTANNPHKYTRELLRTWARIVAATPNSRFAFIRPEGSGASFRANIEREFAAEGVSADRVIWHVIRGAHLPYYNELDVTLDPFPLTGGTTTTEALWMGLPVVSLVGEAFYERLSGSILANAGVPELATSDLAHYHALALELAADRPRRLALRATLRDRMRDGPLGQTEQFARDFYDLVARTVRPNG